MTGTDLLKPALIAALALNVISIVWINHAGSEVPQASPGPPRNAPASCVEPAGHRHALR